MEDKIKEFLVAMKIDKDHDIVIVDPYIISYDDLVAAGVKNIVRIRRPGWGKGNVSDFVVKIGFDEFVKKLEEQDGS